MTPQEFEMVCGFSGKKYLENIQTDYGPLKALTASGMLKPYNSRSLRRREESPKNTFEKKSKRRKKRENEEEVATAVSATTEADDDEGDQGEEDEEQSERAVDNSAEMVSADPVRISGKKKKKKHRDDWKKQFKSESNALVAGAVAAASATAISNVNSFGNVIEMEEMPPQIQAERPESTLVMSTGNPFSITLDQPPKISPSAMIPDASHQHSQQPQTLYVMSPHPSMATPPTPQHNPFASALSPSPISMIPAIAPATSGSGMVPSGTSGGSNGNGTGGGSGAAGSGGGGNLMMKSNQSSGISRIGNVLNVRCKSTTAVLYANKYESGSKGKCIQLGDEWLTPNEFEDRAGSKAKKYLSSIKCMGRPLRVYVNRYVFRLG